MQFPAADSYLQNEVSTASPQKLQLMLIEGALRYGQQAKLHWQAGREEEAGEAIVRCQQITAQLLGGLNPEHNAELARQVAEVYLFVFNSFLTAHLQHDETKLDEALAVLEEEQKTWRQVCSELKTPAASINPPHHAPSAKTGEGLMLEA